MKTFDLKGWQTYEASATAEKKNLYIEVPDRCGIHFECRCENPVTLNAINQEGMTVMLGWGQVVKYTGKLVDVGALEIVTDRPVTYRLSIKKRWWETPDPVPAAVTLEEPVSKPLDDLVREHMLKMLARWQMEGVVASDIELDELMDDFTNGDLDFDQEPDEFGLGYAERLEEFRQAQAEAEAADQAEGPAEPPNAAQGAAPTGSGKPSGA